MSAAALGAVRVLVLDVDDTLYLERDYVRSGFEAVAAFLDEPRFATVAWGLFCDGVRGDTFDRTLAVLDLPRAAHVEELVACYRDHAPVIALADDAVRLLDAARGAGMALAAVTDGPLSSQQAKVAALGLAAWGVDVVCTASYGPGFGKPHPRAFTDIASRVGRVDPSAFVYVADNPTKDFAAPADLGWATVRVRRVGSLHEDVASRSTVDAEVADLDQAGRLLGILPAR